LSSFDVKPSRHHYRLRHLIGRHRIQLDNCTDRAAEDGDDAALMTIDLVNEEADSLRRFEWQDPDHRSHGTTWRIPADFANARARIIGVDM
jgi:hypothetical protein